jgi:hypothetical protein
MDRGGTEEGVRKGPRGIAGVGIFLFFGAAMAFLAGTTLIWQNTPLRRVWVLNAPAYATLAPLGAAIGVPFLFLGASLAVAGCGWYKRRKWGWTLAAIIIATQVVGGLTNLVRGDLMRGGAGAFIAGALLSYVLQPEIRAVFRSKAAQRRS